MPEDFSKTIKEVGKIPDLKYAVIQEIQKSDALNFVSIQGTWSLPNYVNNERNTLVTCYMHDIRENKTKSTPPTIQDKRVVLSAFAPCHSKSAYILQDDECSYLNVCYNGQTFSINLKSEDQHGKVYEDETLSSFCWSRSSKYLAFVAEKKRPKLSSSFSTKTEEHTEGFGEKFARIDDWGEQMTGQHQSVLVVVDTDTQKLNVLNLSAGICGGQIVWTPEDTLVGTAFLTEPYRLGLIYCTNRESTLFHMGFDGKVSELTSKGNHVQDPRFSPDGSQLLFLQSPIGGPHVRSSQLCLMDWKTRKVSVLIDYVPKVLQIVDNHSFYGLCGRSVLPVRCWSKESDEVVFSALHHFAYGTYVVNVATKEIRQLPTNGFLFAFDVHENYILASYSTLTESPRITLIPISAKFPDNLLNSVSFLSPPNLVDGIPAEWKDQWTTVNRNPHPVETVSDSPIPAIYFGPITQPSAGRSHKRPLIVWVHGGPHSMFQNRFLFRASVFVRHGYSILLPNYRGSLGQGRDALESLPGNCGNTDVDDVYQATIHCLNRYKSVLDENRVALYGGSHGGFLVTHLSAQHPELYKVVSAINPVIDIATMTTTTDITDWNFVESGHNYEFGNNLSGDILSRMFKMSPLSLVGNVKAPTLILLGQRDRRVPMSQGLFYHKILLARDIPTKTYIYDDCHPLSKLEVEADALIQALLWYQKYL